MTHRRDHLWGDVIGSTYGTIGTMFSGPAATTSQTTRE